jgi:hypothetical protein
LEAGAFFGAAEQNSATANKVRTTSDKLFRRNDPAGICTRRRIACFPVRESGFTIGLEKAAFWRCSIRSDNG